MSLKLIAQRSRSALERARNALSRYETGPKTPQSSMELFFGYRDLAYAADNGHPDLDLKRRYEQYFSGS